jgi:hypothetical protein
MSSLKDAEAKDAEAKEAKEEVGVPIEEGAKPTAAEAEVAEGKSAAAAAAEAKPVYSTGLIPDEAAAVAPETVDLGEFGERVLKATTALHKLEKSEIEATSSLARLGDLTKLHDTNSNFRMMDMNTYMLAEAACLMSRGGVRRQIAYTANPALLGVEAEKQSNAAAEGAMDDYNAAMKIFGHPHLVQQEPKQCGLGKADVLKLRGMHHKMFAGDSTVRLQQASDDWEAALGLYEEWEAVERMDEMAHQLELLALETDRVAFITTRMEKMKKQGNREKEALLAAFQKFDRDNSGEMDTKELLDFATEMGTLPPLRPEEMEEGLKQFDMDGTGTISFDELYTWWISDDVEDAVRATQKRARGSHA